MSTHRPADVAADEVDDPGGLRGEALDAQALSTKMVAMSVLLSRLLMSLLDWESSSSFCSARC